MFEKHDKSVEINSARLTSFQQERPIMVLNEREIIAWIRTEHCVAKKPET